MNLRELKIERKRYGKDEGKLVGTVAFDNEDGAVLLNLTAEQVQPIVALMADAIVQQSQQVAIAMVAPLLTQSRSKS